jgi:hypothetical protein
MWCYFACVVARWDGCSDRSTATGATVGALMEPVIGWQRLFLTLAALSTLV